MASVADNLRNTVYFAGGNNIKCYDVVDVINLSIDNGGLPIMIKNTIYLSIPRFF
jgi:hypothetical protein